MKKDQLRSLIREELKTSLNEYQDKFKMVGKLVTNIDLRPQKEIYSDIRSITGITVISSEEPLEYSQQDTSRFQSILTVKVDGYPFIAKGGFSRDKLQEIIKQIIKVEGVLAFNVNPDNISGI
jgi:hypothetical protein